MGPEQNNIDVDPVDELVNDAVAVISRKATRENRKNAYGKQRAMLRIEENDTLYMKVAKMQALYVLEEMRDKLLLDDQGPSRPDLELHRGSKQMAKDPAGDR